MAAGFHNHPLLTAPIEVSGPGATTIIAGSAQNNVCAYKIFFVVDADVDVTIKSGTTALTGALPFKAGGSMILDFDSVPWFVTAPGQALVLDLSTAAGVHGAAYYTVSVLGIDTTTP